MKDEQSTNRGGGRWCGDEVSSHHHRRKLHGIERLFGLEREGRYKPRERSEEKSFRERKCHRFIGFYYLRKGCLSHFHTPWFVSSKPYLLESLALKLQSVFLISFTCILVNHIFFFTKYNILLFSFVISIIALLSCVLLVYEGELATSFVGETTLCLSCP